MQPEEAEEVINDYLRSHNKDLIAQPLSDLPHSPAKIKYAHFVLTEYLIKNNLYTDDIHKNFCNTYQEIDKFYFENHQEIIEQYNEYVKKLQEGILEENPLRWIEERALSDVIEFHNFVVDCQGNWNM